MAKPQINIKKQLSYFPDVEHITELNSDLSLRERDCLKSNYHDGYITMYEFNKFCQSVSGPEVSENAYLKTEEQILLKGFSANNKLPEFLKYMAFLTGIIMVKHGKCKLTFWGRFFSLVTQIVFILCRLILLRFKQGDTRIFQKKFKLRLNSLQTSCYTERLTGSGFVQKIRREANKPCPCHVCAKRINTGVDPECRYAIITITTVLHVFEKDCKQALQRGFIKDAWRSENTKVRLFYDNEEESTEDLYGYRLLETDKEVNIDSDWCAVECVTHDMELVGKLEQILKRYKTLQGEIYKDYTDNIGNYKGMENLVIIIGHPHGGPKKISVGEHNKKVVLKEVRNSQRWCSYEYTNITCGGSSGSPVFILGQALCGFGYWFGHPHNHSKSLKPDEKGGISSLGVEYKE